MPAHFVFFAVCKIRRRFKKMNMNFIKVDKSYQLLNVSNLIVSNLSFLQNEKVPKKINQNLNREVWFFRK